MVKAVSDKYKLVGITEGKHQVAEFGIIDFSKIDLGLANQLYKAGVPFLVKKNKSDIAEEK
ncbi:hypothetical protein SAMN05421827_109127 [Pedobacter terrae]|uniref:Uncharacterized protein n=1 Tax=Pedobacter terrae TaxID=405671 RepID=A0A1G7W6X2_9SPHI|nr:hypothetical protein [Pedobacter terrae]SDG67732.1 hypothetical protein SAMN05421827_109127 [Pedobacter terrae]